MAFDGFEATLQERNRTLREPDRVDYWFPALGLPETRQNGPGLWTATGPCGQVIVDHAGDILARMPDDPDNLIWTPLDFVAEVLGVFDDDGDYDRDTAWRLASGQEAYVPGPFKPALAFADKPVPCMKWHVPGMVPHATATLLTGDGGTGKSLIAMQLAVASAAGALWIGQEVTPGPVVYFSAEDDEQELHRRLDRILIADGLAYADVSGLFIRSTVGEGALLAERGRESFKPSALAREIEAFARQTGARLVVLDTLANFYPGDENDRAQTTQFVDIVKGIALRCECAVVVLAHPSKSAMESGAGYSGSTAWHNAVRSRLYLKRVIDAGYEADPDARVLRTTKSNYGPVGGELALTYSGGVFVTREAETGLDRMAATARAERVFLDLLGLLTSQGRRVNDSGGQTYAPNVFANHPKAEGITRKAFRSAMENLLSDGRIQVAEDGPASKRRRFLEVVR